MINLMLFIFGVIGMTHIIVDSVLFAPVRAFIIPKLWSKLVLMLNCYQCTGTWCGFFCGYLMFDGWRAILLSGFAGSFLAMLGANILTSFNVFIYRKIPDDPVPDDPEV